MRPLLRQERARVLAELQQLCPAASAPAGRRVGRPRKSETGKDTLIIAALEKYHAPERKSLGNPTPAALAEVVRLGSDPRKGVSISKSAVSRFFTERFSGYGGYKAACADGTIGLRLALWSGELSPERLAPLRPHETGQDEE